jgi:hypothetical protein
MVVCNVKFKYSITNIGHGGGGRVDEEEMEERVVEILQLIDDVIYTLENDGIELYDKIEKIKREYERSGYYEVPEINKGLLISARYIAGKIVLEVEELMKLLSLKGEVEELMKLLSQNGSEKT